MKVLACTCGADLAAEDEQALFQKVKEHVGNEHPALEFTDEDVQNLIAEQARDA